MTTPSERPIAETENSFDKLIHIFEEEQQKWTETIMTRTRCFKDMQMMPELMLNIYNDRQSAVIRLNYYKNMAIKLRQKYNEKEKERWYYYRHVHDERLNNLDTQRAYIKGDLAPESAKLELLLNQFAFFEQQVKTIDSIIFGINSRRDLEQYRRG